MWVLLILIGGLFTMFYIITIRGNHKNNPHISDIIDSFLTDSDTIQLNESIHWKTFKNGDWKLKVWNENWPYAYANQGTLLNEKTNEYKLKWYNENPKFSTRLKIKNWSK